MTDDAALVEGALRGDSDSFGALVRRYESMVRALVHRIGARSDEDDLTQQALLTAHQKLESLKDPRKFESWLWGITSRIAWKWSAGRRRQAAADTVALDDIEEPHAKTDFLSPAERVELRDRIAAAIGTLPEAYQMPIVYRYLDGLSYAEIAEVSKLSPGQTRARIQRGTQMMRTRLQSVWRELYNEPVHAPLPDEIGHILQHHPGSVMVISDALDILAVNDPYTEQTGYKASSTVGRKCYEVSHGRSEPCDGVDHPCPIELLRGTEHVKVQHTHCTSDGKKQPVNVTLFPIDEETPAGIRRYYIEEIVPADAGSP